MGTTSPAFHGVTEHRDLRAQLSLSAASCALFAKPGPGAEADAAVDESNLSSSNNNH